MLRLLLAEWEQGGNQVPVLVDEYAYKFDAIGSNSMKSKNPYSGCNKTDIANCLDTFTPSPSKNQGGLGIIDCYCLQGNMIGRETKNGPQGSGINEGVSFTLNATDRHAVTNNLAESRIRRLTPLECERLQGLPDNWTEGGSDSSRYKAIGNGMATPCSDYILKRIAECS